VSRVLALLAKFAGEAAGVELAFGCRLKTSARRRLKTTGVFHEIIAQEFKCHRGADLKRGHVRSSSGMLASMFVRVSSKSPIRQCLRHAAKTCIIRAASMHASYNRGMECGENVEVTPR